MRCKFLIILFLSFCLCQSGICQKKPKVQWGSDDTTIPTSLTLAKFQINDIKTRGIIVRLRTDKDRIAAYRKKGNTKIADEKTMIRV